MTTTDRTGATLRRYRRVVIALAVLTAAGALLLADAWTTPGDQVAEAFIGGALAGFGIGPFVALALGRFEKKS
jgi:hypothetical protein